MNGSKIFIAFVLIQHTVLLQIKEESNEQMHIDNSISVIIIDIVTITN